MSTRVKSSSADVHSKGNSRYSYVILVTCFLISFIIDGTLYAFGAMKNYIKDYFGASEVQSSGVGSIANGAYLICGPLAAIFEQRYGCRATAIVGSLAASLSMFVSTLSPNITFMMATYGLLAGAGSGFAYLPVITAVSKYFQNRSALAMSVNVMGSGLGTIVVAPLAAKLVDSHGWKVGVYILASAVLFCAAGGALLKPPPSDDAESGDGEAGYTTDARKHVERIRSPDADDNSQDGPALAVLIDEDETRRDKPESNILGNEQNHSLLPSGSKEQKKALADSETGVSDSRDTKPTMGYEDFQDPSSKPPRNLKSVWQSFLYASGFGLLQKDKRFVLICLANVLSMIGYYIPYLFLASLGESMGMPRVTSAYLISTLGILNTISRPLTGFVVEFTPLSALTLNNIGLLMSSLVTFPIAIYNRTTLFVYAGLFGFFIAPHISMTPVFLTDIFGKPSVARSYGMIMFFRGITSAVAPMVCGKLTERTKSFTAGFILGAVTLLTSSLLHSIVSVMELCRKRQNISQVAPIGTNRAR